ncbi:VOC family protein [Micromonospora sp. NPDC048935]|uniref:VOC family protein n=1 Tax=Micromonospora sp. NPDC048935 TaxID=3364262 RepID=UPI003718FAD5
MTAVAPVGEMVVGLPEVSLRPFVDRYVGYRERADVPLVRRESAGVFVVLILGWGAPLDVTDPRSAERGASGVDSFVAGTFDGWCTTRTAGVGQGVELLLAPLTARRLLGLPLNELTNRAVDVGQLPGRWLDRLRGRLAEAAGWPQRFALLDSALAGRLAASPPVDARLDRAWRWLVANGGREGVGVLADELGWSRRHLAARFRQEIGLPPKTVARLLRFQQACTALTDVGSRSHSSNPERSRRPQNGVMRTIYPVLRYPDPRAAIDWLCSAFGFQVHAVHETPDGAVAHAELVLDSGMIMLAGRADATSGPADAGRADSAPRPADDDWSVYVAVPDVDAHCAQARLAGAEITQEPFDTDYGSRDYAARDLAGTVWAFGTYRP